MRTIADKQRNLGLQDCSLTDLLFPVEMVEQTKYDCNSDYAYDIFGYPKRTKKRIVLNENNEPVLDEKGKPIYQYYEDNSKLRLNSCSARYALVPNAEIFPPILEMLKKNNIRFNPVFMHLNYARFYGEMTIENYVYQVGNSNQDIIKPMLKIQHSYNGLVEYQITFGYFRVVCTNGLVIPVAEKSEYNICISGKHTKAIHESLKKLEEAVTFFLSQGDKPMKNFEIFAEHWVEKWQDRVVEVMNNAKIILVDNSKLNTMNYVGNIIKKEAEAYSEKKVNDWLIMNAINQYINDDSLNVASPKQRIDKDKAVVNFLLKDLNLV